MPDVFQTAASVLCLRASEIGHGPLKSGVSFSYSPLGLPELTLLIFKAGHMGAHLPGLDPQYTSCMMWDINPSLLVGELCACDIPLTCGHQARGLVPSQTIILFPSCPF